MSTCYVPGIVRGASAYYQPHAQDHPQGEGSEGRVYNGRGLEPKAGAKAAEFLCMEMVKTWLFTGSDLLLGKLP